MVVAAGPPGEIERFMAHDHVRLDRLLAAADRTKDIDENAYARFRHDLLRHIAMEEKVLLPYARQKRGGVPLELAAVLRADHGAIARLLVRSPTAEIIASLREIFVRHNPLEEGPEGLYAACDALAGDEAPRIVHLLRLQPRVPVAKYHDGPTPRRA